MNPNEPQTPQLNIGAVSSCFSVHTYSLISENSPMYVHWSDGLKMIIIKDGVTMRLNSEEIEQLVKALPRTVGGSY
jgi:hypothetical protein